MFNNEFAQAVLEKFASGKPVSEALLVKVASESSLNPTEILLDARFRTKLSNYIKTGGIMDKYERNYYAASAGFDESSIEKIASLSKENFETTVMLALYQNDFDPDTTKIAELGLDGGAPNGVVEQDPDAIQGVSPDNIPQLTNPAAMTSQDSNGQPLTQPQPQSPNQMPEMSQGNGEQLQQNYENRDQIQAQQEQQANEQFLQQNPQPQAPKEQVEASLAQASPEEKAKYISPAATPEQLQRLTEEITKIEQQVGMPVKDPAQLKKIVAGVEKADKKIIDEAIKAQYSGRSGEQATGPLPGTPEAQAQGGGQPQGVPQGQTPGQPPMQPPVDTEKVASYLKRMRDKFYI